MKITEDEYRALCERTLMPVRAASQAVTRKASKYHNKLTEVGGELFHSRGEARRWYWLCELQRQGGITELQRQVEFPLVVRDVEVCCYTADFAYYENGKWVVEDFKGYATDVYKLKKKLLFAVYGIEIKEVTRR